MGLRSFDLAIAGSQNLIKTALQMGIQIHGLCCLPIFSYFSLPSSYFLPIGKQGEE